MVLPSGKTDLKTWRCVIPGKKGVCDCIHDFDCRQYGKTESTVSLSTSLTNILVFLQNVKFFHLISIKTNFIE